MAGDDLITLGAGGGVFSLLAVLLFVLAQRSKRRFERIGEAWSAYAATRGLTFLPIRGGYHYARGIGGPPTLKGTIDGVELEVTANDGKHGDFTIVTTTPPEWFPDGGGASIGVRSGTPSWLLGTTTASGDPEFDGRFVFGMGPEEQAARFVSPAVRACAHALAAFGPFGDITCYNAHGNRTLNVMFRSHVVNPAALDAAVRAIVAIRRT